MKWYIKIELILEVESRDLENFQVWEWVVDEIENTTIHKDIKVVEIYRDDTKFEEWTKDWFEDLF